MTLGKLCGVPSKDKALFSRRDLFRLIFPIIAQQILLFITGTVDTIMVASIGDPAVSGVSLVNTLDTLLILFFNSLVVGGTVVVAQIYGSGDHARARHVAKQLIWAATFMATLLTALILLFRGPLLSLLFGEVEADVMNYAQDYLFWIALSFPFLAVINTAGSLFRVTGDTFRPMLVTLVVNVINVGGNALLIFAFGLGTAGAAISTTFVRILAAVILVWMMQKKMIPLYLEKPWRYRPEFSTIKKILAIGVPNGIEDGMFQFGRVLTQSLISAMGTVVIAGNSVALQLANFQYMAGGAFSAVIITVVGRCIGSGDRAQAKAYSRLLLLLAYFSVGGVAIFTAVFSQPLVNFFSLSPESTKLAIELTLFHSAISLAIWPAGFVLPSSFRAAGDVRFPLIVSMSCMWLLRVAGAYVFALSEISVFGWFTIPGLGLGIWGVWLAMLCDWIVRATSYLIRYFSGAWLKKKSMVE